MNKLTLHIGALTIAAALALIFTSCSSSSDDPTEPQPVVEPTEPAPQTIQITVGAGIDNGASTRSEVETTGEGTSTKRTLKFTAGDRLYVTGTVGTVAEGKILAGFLDATSINGTSATFTGTYTSTNGSEFSNATELHVYQYNTTSKKYLTVSHSFTNTTDPLGECTYVSALLVHNGTIGNLEVYPELSYAQLMPIYNHFLASTIDELMTNCLYVSGPYSDKKFSLAVAESGYCSPIFNCNISGLAANTIYQVEHIFGTENWTTSVGEVKTDGSGKATFAYYISNMKDTTSYSHAIRFKPTSGASSSTWYKIDFGDRKFTNKVYNVTRTSVPTDPGTPGRPTFSITAPEPTAKGGYIFEGDATFTLSGTSTGYYFRFRKTANITLNNFDATYNALNSGLWGFFDCDDNLTLTLTGNNSITCKNKDQCIYVFGNMTLKGTSGAKLTVTCKSSTSGGIRAEGGLSKEGVNVTEPTDNNDGTYTWTYTVN